MTDELKPLSPRLAELLRKESEAALPVRAGAEERLLGMLRIAGNLPTPGGGEGGEGSGGGSDGGASDGGPSDAGSPGAPGGAQGAGGAASAAMPKAAATWLAPKTLLLATATGALGFAGGLAVSPSPQPPVPSVSVSAPAESEPMGEQKSDAGSAHDAGASAAARPDAGMAAARPRPAKRVRPEEPRQVAPEPPPAPSSAEAPDVQHASERQLIDAARVALNRGRSHDALVFLMGHERRFPEGSFEEERELLIIEALVAQNRAGPATQRGKAFLSKFPRSTHAPRVRALIAAP